LGFFATFASLRETAFFSRKAAKAAKEESRMKNLKEVSNIIREKCRNVPAGQALLAGISGIDASGKGYVTRQLAELLRPAFNVAVINIDGWLNLPHIRFCDDDPGRHFYQHALRLDQMFDRLVLPLKRDRRIDLTYDHTAETEDVSRPERILLKDIHVILLEGIFLFQPAYLPYFEMTVWIECSFETALERAISRSQEGLSPKDTIMAYETIYFPAQRVHIETDRPQYNAEITLSNY
jgi:uridine kinase